MKRHLLIASAAVLATGSALAQSSVTIYGRLNTSAERQTNYTTNAAGTTIPGTVYRLANNGSRIGFRGVEDLGGGLKAGFVLEHRFNSDTGAATNSAFWGGAGLAEVNLASNIGMLRLGHFTSEAYFATSDVTDLLNHGTGTSADALYKYLGNDDNKVSYRTPALGPITAEAAVSAGEGIAGRTRIYDGAVNYTAGPVGLGVGYEKVKDGDWQVAVRGSFDFQPFLVTGYVQRYKNAALNDSQTIYRVSGMYTLGGSEFHLAYGHQGDLGSGPSSNVSAKQYTAGYNYNLSKRTKVYAYYSRVANDASNLLDPKTISLGVRHNF